ncbi:hypothetical protein phiOC_p178 [Ochrobactrum phage vB_OspM_OC]|nr:hypothetical protein phiOC_p178 [Ochrobactrum phage vB_OspM_OC]
MSNVVKIDFGKYEGTILVTLEHDVPVNIELERCGEKIERQCDAYDLFHFHSYDDGTWSFVEGIGFKGYRYKDTDYVVGATIQTYDSWSGRDGGDPGIFVIEPVNSYKIVKKKIVEFDD